MIATPAKARSDQDHAIALLAKEFGITFAEVRELYERALADLEFGARVKAYLPIFASRSVRATLRRREAVGPRSGRIGRAPGIAGVAAAGHA